MLGRRGWGCGSTRSYCYYASCSVARVVRSCARSKRKGRGHGRRMYGPYPRVRPRGYRYGSRYTYNITTQRAIKLTILYGGEHGSMPRVQTFFFCSGSRGYCSRGRPHERDRQLWGRVFLPWGYVCGRGQVTYGCYRQGGFVCRFRRVFYKFIVLRGVNRFGVLFATGFLRLPRLFALEFWRGHCAVSALCLSGR